MKTGKFFGFVCGVLLIELFAFGCSSSGRYFIPQNTITIRNNTKALYIDIESGGHKILKDIPPGESKSFDMWSFRNGSQMILSATGHTKDGENRGMAERTIWLTSGGHYGPEHRQEVWRINQRDLSCDVASDGGRWR